MSTILPGMYRHFKGFLVEVIGVSVHSETLEPLVVYRKIHADHEYPAGQLWVRPLHMFLETVEKDGQKIPRFQKVR